MNATVYVGLGSNEGDREAQLVSALEALSRIDAVAEKLRSADPTLQRKLPPAAQIAQWRNT